MINQVLVFIKDNRIKLGLILVLYYVYQRLRNVSKTLESRIFEPLATWARIYCGGGQLSIANMAVIVEDEVKYTKALGKLDIMKEEKSSTNTIFRMFSMTKPMTSVAAMILIERNLLGLEDSVEKYIPQFKNLRVYQSGDTLDNVKTRETETTMTIRHLLSHQSGLSYGSADTHVLDDLYREVFPLGLFAYSIEEFITKLSKLPLLFDPGTHFTYSVATDVLGYIIQVITKEKYSQDLREFIKYEIIDKLHMNDTDFYVPETKLNRLASIYSTGEKQGFGLFPAPPVFSEYGKGKLPLMISGGAGLFSTVEDYPKFLKVFTNNGVSGGVRILSALSVELLTRYNELGEHYCDIKDKHISTDVSTKHFDQETFKSYRYYHGLGFNLMGSILVDPSRAFGAEHSHVGEFGWTGLGGLCFQITHLPVKREGKEKMIGVGLLFMSQTMPDKGLPILPQFRWCGMKCVREFLKSIGYTLG